MFFDNEYMTLDRISTRLNLSKKFLQQQIKAGKIPHLVVKDKLRFREDAVRKALEKIEQAVLKNNRRTVIG